MEVSPDSDAWTTGLRTETPRERARYRSILTDLWSGGGVVEQERAKSHPGAPYLYQLECTAR